MYVFQPQNNTPIMERDTPLTIAFDAKRALLNFTGLGNYSRYAIEALAEYFPQNHYELYTHKLKDDSRVRHILDIPNTTPVLPDTRMGRALPALWRLAIGITNRLKRGDIDIFHGLSNELPFDIARSGIPSVVTIHDLIFRRIPANYKPIDRKLYDFKFRRAANIATRVIAISERTKLDLMELYDIDPAKIDVIYQGCSPLFTSDIAPAMIQHVRNIYNLPQRYITMVGTVEQRKNQILAVKALPDIPHEVKLVIVGRERNGYGKEIADMVQKLHLSNRVIHLTGVPTEHLPTIYNQAEIAAYPSRYEGFGLPVIEALSCGTPVIAATGSCLEEAGGAGALYVNPDSPEEFAKAACTILDDETLRNNLIEAGRAHIARFNRRNFAEQVTATYHRAIESR